MISSLLRYNGERVDPVSGLAHLGSGYRAYYSILMKFNCPDNCSPFSDGGINSYAYCIGDPVNRSDPSGHVSISGWVNIGLGALSILLAPFSGGSSLAITVITATSAVTSGALAIASGVLSDSRPKASEALGWASLGASLPAMALGAWQLGRSVMKGMSQALARVKTFPTIEGHYEVPPLKTPGRVMAGNEPRGRVVQPRSLRDMSVDVVAQNRDEIVKVRDESMWPSEIHKEISFQRKLHHAMFPSGHPVNRDIQRYIVQGLWLKYCRDNPSIIMENVLRRTAWRVLGEGERDYIINNRSLYSSFDPRRGTFLRFESGRTAVLTEDYNNLAMRTLQDQNRITQIMDDF